MFPSYFKTLFHCTAEQVIGTMLGRNQYTVASPQDHSGLGWPREAVLSQSQPLLHLFWHSWLCGTCNSDVMGI